MLSRVRALIFIVVVLSACNSRTYLGSKVGPAARGTPGLANGHVYIPFARTHYDEYHDDGGIVSWFSNDAESFDSEATKSEKLGFVVVDLRTGRCKFEKRVPGQRATIAWAKGFSLDDEHVTPSGVRVVRRAGRVTANERPFVNDPKGDAVYIPGSDAIAHYGQVFDTVDEESFRFVTGIARYGDRLFLPTTFEGVVELTAAPVARVASYVPPMLIPTDAPWIEPITWKVGDKHGDATLVRDGKKLVLDSPRGRVLLGENVTVRLFADRYAVTDGIIYDLKEGEMTTKIASVTRIAKHRWELLIDAGGVYWQASERLTRVRKFEAELRPIGVDRDALVMHMFDRESIFVFDFATRTWRELPFAACIPRK